MDLPFEFHSSLRYLRFHPGKTALLVSGVGVGTLALVIALSFQTGMKEGVRARILGSSGHLTVMTPLGGKFAEWEDLAAGVETVPGVTAAGPVLHTEALLVAVETESSNYAEIKAVDPDRHAVVMAGREAAADSPFAALGRPTASGRDGILLGEELAARLHVFEGDTVRLLVPTVTLGPLGPVPKSRSFEVVGTYRSDFFQEDSIRAYVPLPVLQRLTRAEGQVSWMEVRLDDLRRLDAMKETLRGGLGADWRVIDLIEENRDIMRALNWEKVILFLAIGLIVVVAALNVLLSLVLMVANKTKEIGILAAMGARPRRIAMVFVFQGLLIGVAGTIIGLVLGSVAAWGLNEYELIRLDPEVYYLAFVPFTIRVMDLAAIAVVALLISLGSTVYPAWKAARLDPVEALRYE